MKRGLVSLLVLLSIIILGDGCSLPSGPKFPTYEVNLDIPLAQEVITMEKLVLNREEYLSIDSTGTVAIKIEQDLDRFIIGDNLRVLIPGLKFDLSIPAKSGNLNSQKYVKIQDDIDVIEAKVKFGALRFNFENRSGRTLEVLVGLPDLTLDDSSITNRTVVLPGKIGASTILLDGAWLRPVSPRQLRVNINVNVGIRGNAGTLAISIGSDPIRMDKVRGSFKNLRVNFKPSKKPVHFPKGEIDITLKKATVKVQITNEIGADSKLDLKAIGRKEDGQSVILTIPTDQQEIVGGKNNEPVVSLITFDETNSNVLEFLNLIPSTIELQGGILIHDLDAWVNQTDAMGLKIIFQSPLDLVMGETLLFTDSKDISIDDKDIRDRLMSHFGVSILTFKMTNHLPIGLGVQLLVGGDSTRLVADPELLVPREGELFMGAAQIDHITGLARESAFTQQQIELRPEEIKVFSKYPLFSRISIRISSTGGRQISILESDFAEIIVRANVQVKVDEDLIN